MGFLMTNMYIVTEKRKCLSKCKPAVIVYVASFNILILKDFWISLATLHKYFNPC